MKRIALLKPDLPARQEIESYLARIDAARWYTNFGPLVRELEARLATYFARSAPQPISVRTVANASLGLELALAAMALPARSQVLVPAVTFVATGAAIVRAGHIPCISDVDPGSWQLTPEIARIALGRHPIAAVLPVCAYGCSQDAGAWDQFAAQTATPVLIDAAGGFGNQAAGAKHCTVFSLHATKSFSAGEGGFVVSSDPNLVEQVKKRSNFGIDISSGFASVIGTNAKLSEYHAAVALAMLDGWEKRRLRRLELHSRYIARLVASCPGVIHQERSKQAVYSILPVLMPPGHSARAVQAQLAAAGIESRRWYLPSLDEHPAFRGFPVADDLAVTRVLQERLLALPFHPSLDDQDMAFVCEQLGLALHA